MSIPERRPSLSALPDATGAGAEGDERAQRNGSSWPTAPLTAWTMTALVTMAVSAPVALHDIGSALVPVLVVPAGLATLAGRLMFESLDGAARPAGLPAHALAGVAASAVAALIMGAAAAILGLPEDLAVILVSVVLGTVVLGGAGVVRDLEIRVRLSLRRVFFAGSGESLRDLRRELLQSPEARLVGTVPARAPLDAEGLSELVRASGATVLVLDRAAAAAPAVITAASALSERGVRVRDLLSYYEREFRKVPLTELTPAWFLFEREHHDEMTLADALRRVTMSLTAAAMLLASLPLLALLAVAVRLSSPGPAIFRQVRVGRNGRHFTLLKLRTMITSDAPPDAGQPPAAWATDEAHRITALGRVLRRYRLDELPQLWNIMRGELALVGPRPEQVPIVERLEREIPYYAARHTVRPGLTGWAQVNLGYAGSLEGARAKLQRDLYYVKHRSLSLDLLIVWLTVKAIFTDPS